MKISLIVSTYNRPEALRLSLESALHQSLLPHEILVADDGSGGATRAVVVEFQQQTQVPVRHIWHEDRGFRLAAIRNKALKAATGDYIVQIDGDIVLHRHFLRDHQRYAKRGYWLKGSRAMLPPSITQAMEFDGAKLPEPVFFQPNIEKRKVLLPFGWLTGLLGYNMPYKGVLGGNMSYWKADAVEINGFDEAFEGWGKEDDDFVHRLMRKGVKPAVLLFAAKCYHLHHPEADRSKFAINAQLLQKRDASGMIEAGKGLREID